MPVQLREQLKANFAQNLSIAPQITVWENEGFVCYICKQHLEALKIGEVFRTDNMIKAICEYCNMQYFVCKKGCKHERKDHKHISSSDVKAFIRARYIARQENHA